MARRVVCLGKRLRQFWGRVYSLAKVFFGVSKKLFGYVAFLALVLGSEFWGTLGERFACPPSFFRWGTRSRIFGGHSTPRKVIHRLGKVIHSSGNSQETLRLIFGRPIRAGSKNKRAYVPAPSRIPKLRAGASASANSQMLRPPARIPKMMVCHL